MGSNPTVTAIFESRFSLIQSAETGLVSFGSGSIVATALPVDLGVLEAVCPFGRAATARVRTGSATLLVGSGVEYSDP